VALVCGHVTLDRVEGRLVPGGSAWYAARALHALGAEVRVLTAAGPDFPGAALHGVAAQLVAAPRTTLFVNAHAPDGRRTQVVEAAAPPLSPDALPRGWRDADVLHLAPVLHELELAAFGRAVRARVVGVGVQGLVRSVSPDGTVDQPRWEVDARELSFVTAACLGEDDLRGQGDLVARLAAVVPIVVVTHGAAGSEVIVRGRTTRVGIHPAREIDPTGAGDVFAAAFLLGLARGADPVQAARLGAGAASIVVEAIGGDALARLGEAEARAALVPVLGVG
jgi:sugar/nucleoside kinase (ribokinase family)